MNEVYYYSLASHNILLVTIAIFEESPCVNHAPKAFLFCLCVSYSTQLLSALGWGCDYEGLLLGIRQWRWRSVLWLQLWLVDFTFAVISYIHWIWRSLCLKRFSVSFCSLLLFCPSKLECPIRWLFQGVSITECVVTIFLLNIYFIIYADASM